LHGAAIRRIQCHVIPEPRATLQGEGIPSAILKSFFGLFYYFCFPNAVCSSASGGFRIVFDTLLLQHLHHNPATHGSLLTALAYLGFQ